MKGYLSKFFTTKNSQKILYSASNTAYASTEDAKKLWALELEFDEVWKKRISVMASYIDIPGSVMDLGCGMMWLEDFLSEDNSYIPVDYIQRDHRTIVVDLNNEPIPAVDAEIAYLSGVLEYIEDLDRFINELTKLSFRKIVLSYCTLEKFPDISRRKSFNWVSHESIFKVLSLFISKYDLSAIDDVNNNTILVFDKKLEG